MALRPRKALCVGCMCRSCPRRPAPQPRPRGRKSKSVPSTALENSKVETVAGKDPANQPHRAAPASRPGHARPAGGLACRPSLDDARHPPCGRAPPRMSAWVPAGVRQAPARKQPRRATHFAHEFAPNQRRLCEPDRAPSSPRRAWRLLRRSTWTRFARSSARCGWLQPQTIAPSLRARPVIPERARTIKRVRGRTAVRPRPSGPKPPQRCSALCATLSWRMASPPPLSLRLGPDGLSALDEIARRRGITRAEAARRAIAETAKRERRRADLAAEARRLMQDRAYVREAREVALLMEELRDPR
jgi:predicted transcriptional regulator